MYMYIYIYIYDYSSAGSTCSKCPSCVGISSTSPSSLSLVLIYPSIYLSVCLSICRYIYLYIYIYIRVYIRTLRPEVLAQNVLLASASRPSLRHRSLCRRRSYSVAGRAG